ncbi:putative T7SS-secreted protein, partial [Glaciibacter psychrotolerans]
MTLLTARSTVEELAPGSPLAIAGAVECTGAGIAPTRNGAQMWEAVQAPSWKGQAASSFSSVAPLEAARLGVGPAAFNRTAAALMRYESAFVATRAELDAAIGEAALAERATTQAKQDYFEAVQKVALAEPGTPGAILRPYYDPGAQRLAQAQLAVDALRTRLAQTGDEVAAEVQAAANTTSGKSSEISVWDQIVMFPGTLVEGFILQGVDTAVGVWDLTPGPYIWDELFNGGDSWTDSFGEVWPGIIDSIVNDPGGAALEMWNGFIAADHWDGYTGGGVGRVLFNGASLFVGGGG